MDKKVPDDLLNRLVAHYLVMYVDFPFNDMFDVNIFDFREMLIDVCNVNESELTALEQKAIDADRTQMMNVRRN